MSNFDSKTGRPIGLEKYTLLKSIADRLVRREMVCTLTATGLVHEWFLKSMKSRQSGHGSSRVIFETIRLGFVSRVMKQILIDRGRSRIARNRVEANASLGLVDDAWRQKFQEADEFILEFHDILSLMEKSMPENAEMVRLRVFEGKSIQEAADQLGMSRATAFRKWNFSKLWLKSRLVIER